VSTLLDLSDAEIRPPQQSAVDVRRRCVAALLAGLTGTTWALVRAWAAEIQLAGQVRELNQRNVHLLKQINVTMSQAEGLDRLDQATCRLLDQLTKQVSQDERLDIPDLREVKNELLEPGFAILG
jgi:hypothetical protein